MLNSRYVHLHEALGLGVMWLKQCAKVIDLPHNKPHSAPASPSKRISSPVSVYNGEMHPARLAVLQKIQSVTLPSASPQNTNIPQTTEQPDVYSTADYVVQLSGSLKTAKVMALSVCASPADVMAGKLLSGEDGVLFHKMLTAIQLSEDDVYLSSWLKDLPTFTPKPSTEMVQAAAPRIQAEWQLCGAKALLLMGEFFERDDVKACLPNAPTFVIAHPQRILSNTTLKRPAWEVLQKLQKHLDIQ